MKINIPIGMSIIGFDIITETTLLLIVNLVFHLLFMGGLLMFEEVLEFDSNPNRACRRYLGKIAGKSPGDSRGNPLF